VASILLAVSALPNTSGIVDLVCALAGLSVLLVGLLIGVVAAAKSAGRAERPVLTAELVDDGLHLKVNATAENRASDTRLVILVDGLVTEERVDPKTRKVRTRFDAHNLEQIYVGPNGEGKFDVPVAVRIPAGRFDSVGIRSWTDTDPKSGNPEDQERPCSRYPRQVSALELDEQSNRVQGVGTGCLILPLPPIPASPRLSLTWAGEGKSSDRLVLGVATENAPTRLNGERACTPVAPRTSCGPREGQAVRVAVQVKGELRGLGPAKDAKDRRAATRLLYRALLRPDGNGHLAFSAHLPIANKFRRVCAEAAFVRSGVGFISDTGCPSGATITRARGRALIELRPPDARLR
jgi:hypothetical protein